MKNPKRTFLIGFIVGLLFFGWWFRGFLYINWHFRLFSWDSWVFLFREIGSGWRLSNKGDWIFLLSFILSLPLYFLICYWVNKIHWEALLKKSSTLKQKLRKAVPVKATEPTKKETTVKKSPQKAPPITAQRPMAMPSFGHTMRTKPIQKETEFQPMSFTQQPQPDYFDSRLEKSPDSAFKTSDISSWESLGPDLQQMAQTPLSDIQLPQNQSVDEDIDTILKDAHWTRLNNLNLNGQKVDLLLCQGQALVMLIDDAGGDWLADEEAFNDEDPLWFSETDHRTSPVFTLGVTAKKLSEKLSSFNLKIQPLLVIRNGNIINAEDMLKTWNDLGAIVCRTASGGPVQLKTFSEVFNQPETPIQDTDLEKIKQLLS